jgi:hypothetical protein
MANCYKAFINRFPWKLSEFPTYTLWINSETDEARIFRQGWAARCDTARLIKEQSEEITKMNDFEFNIPNVSEARKAIDEKNKGRIVAQVKELERIISEIIKMGLREIFVPEGVLKGPLEPSIRAKSLEKGYKCFFRTDEGGRPGWFITVEEIDK